MQAYYTLMEVAVMHSYFTRGVCRHLEFIPTPETLDVVQRNQLLLRNTTQGIVVLALRPNADEPPHVANNAVEQLRFAVLSHDAAFWTYTARTDGLSEQTPLYFSDQALSEDSQALRAQALPAELTPNYWRSIFGSTKLKKPCIVIDVHFSEENWQSRCDSSTATSGSAHKNCLVSLQAREVNWKYYFWGQCAKMAIEIVDLNKAVRGIGFESSLTPVAKGGAAWVSTSAIPMREVPTQRFQLREVQSGGESAERVLIKRLPNADITKLGKERLRDGIEVLVAEVYVNQ